LALDVPARHRVVVAKSLGAHALPLAVEHCLPGIWLAPLRCDRAQVGVLRQASAATFVVGGTADPYWDQDCARRLAEAGCP
jgi:hypothetical protein